MRLYGAVMTDIKSDEVVESQVKDGIEEAIEGALEEVVEILRKKPL